MTQTTQEDARHYGTHVFAKAPNVPDGSFGDREMSGARPLAGNKTVRHQSVDEQLFEAATTITALTRDLHVCRKAGTLVDFEAVIQVAADDASRTVTVDLQKSTGGGAYATVLSATIDFANTSTIRVPLTATISSAALVDGDLLRAVVTVAGGSGNQAKGLLVSLTMEEAHT